MKHYKKLKMNNKLYSLENFQFLKPKKQNMETTTTIEPYNATITAPVSQEKILQYQQIRRSFIYLWVIQFLT